MTTDQEVYRPLPEIVAAANVKSYEEMAGFWAQRAQEFGWFKPRDKVLDDPNKPFFLCKNRAMNIKRPQEPKPHQKSGYTATVTHYSVLTRKT
jgi:hypothetical protein